MVRPAMFAPFAILLAVLLGLVAWTRWRQESSPEGLVAAIVAGDDARAARIVEAGADPNAVAEEVPRGRARASVIVLAIERRLVRTVAALVRAKADVARCVPEPALHAAARADLDDMCALLVGRGARLDVRDPNGRTALQVAAESGSERALRMLLRVDHDRDLVRGTGDSLLHLAARSGDSGCVKAVLDDGADLEARNARRETPLIVAARSGRSEAADALIKAGANVNAESEEGSALVHAMERDPATALLLIEAGARVQGHRGEWSPLHRAVRFPEVVRALLRRGARANDRNPLGQTALHLAVEARRVETVRELLAYHADPLASDDKGATPVQYLDRPRPVGPTSPPDAEEAIRRLLAQASK